MDKELEGKILSWMPWLPTVFKRLEKELRRFDVRYPAKTLSRLNDLAGKFQVSAVIDEGRIIADMRHLLGATSVQQELRQFLLYAPKAAKKEASADPHYSLLLKLVSKADEQVPLISLVPLFNAADPTKTLRPQCEPLDLIEQAEKARGEARAKAALRAYQEVAEWLYKPYLRRLWMLSCVITNDWKKPPEYFGNLVTQLGQRLVDYPGLVEADAGWKRNAAAHGHWEYVRAEDALIMWDKNRPRSKVPVDELMTQLRAMYRLSGPTVTFVAQLYLFRNFMWNTGLVDAFLARLPHLCSADETRRADAERELIEKAVKVMEPMGNFFAANSQAATAVAP